MSAEAEAAAAVPKIAILGAGIFVRTQYIPRLREIADSVIIKAIWSRTEESARAAAELARDIAPEVECKWGDAGLEDIMQDTTISGVAVVLAGQVQVGTSLRMLKAGKHVIQEKPAAASTIEAEAALLSYNSSNHFPHRPIWAVAENYRFEPAFVESRKLINDIGDMMNVHVVVEGSMNSSNPYFSSSWRRNFTGGFILDMGVHFIAGLRMMVGCEITRVSAIARHVDMSLPSPDNLCALFTLENGCAGVFVMAVSSSSPKIYWRVDGTKGAIQIERGLDNGRHGYVILFYTLDGRCQRTFYPFSGVTEELKIFLHDISQSTKTIYAWEIFLNVIARTRIERTNTLNRVCDIPGCSSSCQVQEAIAGHEPDPRSSYAEGARDVAVLEAMLESSTNNGVQVDVKKF